MFKLPDALLCYRQGLKERALVSALVIDVIFDGYPEICK